MDRLDDALDIGPTDTVAAVGAGGKKSLLYSLATESDGAVVTSTVHIPEFDDAVDALHVTDTPTDAVAPATESVVGVVPARAPPDRYVGYPPETVDAIADAAPGRTLVKADGARMRRFKAPNDDEPVIPDTTDVLTPIASVQVVGNPLDDALVHRPERVASLLEQSTVDAPTSIGDTLTTSDLATVLAHSDGGLKDAPPTARVVPVLNMVDDPADETTGREIARELLGRSDRVDRVVLTCLVADDPVVAVLT